MYFILMKNDYPEWFKEHDAKGDIQYLYQNKELQGVIIRTDSGSVTAHSGDVIVQHDGHLSVMTPEQAKQFGIM